MMMMLDLIKVIGQIAAEVFSALLQSRKNTENDTFFNAKSLYEKKQSKFFVSNLIFLLHH